MRAVFHLVPAALICMLLAGCNGVWNEASTTAHEGNGDFVQTDRPNAERSALKGANDALAIQADPNQPIMDVPARPGGGVLDEIQLPGQKGRNAATKGGPVADDLADGPRQPIELQFVDASLRTVIDTLFAQYLKKPYAVLPDYKDIKVNWIVSGSYTDSEILRMFTTFLEVHGVSLTQRENGYYVSSLPQRGSGIDEQIGQTTGIWRLEHVDAKELVIMVRIFVTSPDRIMVLDSSNILIVTAPSNEIRNVDGFLAKVDVPTMQNRHIMIYTPRYLSPAALVALLENLPKRLGSSLVDVKKGIDADAVAGTPKVVIVTSSDEMKQVVERYLKEIDQAGSDRRQVFYYTAHNQKAEEIRATLDQLLKSIFKDPDQVQGISIITHAPSNSLLITATPDEYYQIKRVIDRIDFSVPSMLLDAVVAQVSLTNELANGVEWFLSGKNSQVSGNFSTPATTFSPTAALSALSLKSGMVATLNLLSSKARTQVLSRPRVIVRNKVKATIKSVQQIRILKTTSNSSVQVSGSSQLVDEYEDKEVGITLECTPTIADDGTISLVFHIEDSDQGPLTNGQPSFDSRKIDTEFIVSNGETIFIGGVIKRQNGTTKQGVPLLGDIPGLDNLFATNDANTQSSELIIMVTPYVYTDKYAARILTDAFAGYFQPGQGK